MKKDEKTINVVFDQNEQKCYLGNLVVISYDMLNQIIIAYKSALEDLHKKGKDKDE